MSNLPEHETVILSDLHLGTPDAKARQATAFLDGHPCRRLILNGDIIDGWALRRGGVWKDSHTAFIRRVLRCLEEGTEVIYIRGNHDDLLERFLPLALGRLRVVREYVHMTPAGPYLVVHGDGFDLVTTQHKAIAIAGSVAYELLLRVNRIYARWRRFRGLEPFSLSQAAKAKVKSAVNHLGRYELQLRELARQRGCRGVICGHVHTAADRWLDGVHYLNSGDWVESMTAIVESEPGRFEVVSFEDFSRKTAEIHYPDSSGATAALAAS